MVLPPLWHAPTQEEEDIDRGIRLQTLQATLGLLSQPQETDALEAILEDRFLEQLHDLISHLAQGCDSNELARSANVADKSALLPSVKAVANISASSTSSTSNVKNLLVDDSSSWESAAVGRQGHWLLLRLHPDAVVTRLSLTADFGTTFEPQQITVLGGSDMSNLSTMAQVRFSSKITLRGALANHLRQVPLNLFPFLYCPDQICPCCSKWLQGHFD
jgi:hypothetical protein